MSLGTTPSAQRTQIGIFGRRNAGKSSLVNALTGQQTAIVSDVPGTTTDPVRKAMELLPLGPVTLIDTPGLDDQGELGALRVRRAEQVLRTADIALLVVDSGRGLSPEDEALLARIRTLHIPHLVVMNQCDKLVKDAAREPDYAYVSSLTGEGIEALKERVARMEPDAPAAPLISDLVAPLDKVILVIPIDEAAPKGRLILPQQQVIRELLDVGALPILCRDTELAQALASTPDARMVVTDSQAFEAVARVVPPTVPLTSFSILMARHKGFLDAALEAVSAIDALRAHDRVLIAEGCTHHRQCNDIGTVKIPRWMQKHCGFPVQFDTVSGGDFPDDLGQYKLVIHCGGCMLTPRQVQTRMKMSLAQGVPFINYGLLIAHLHGVLSRSVEVFGR